MSIPHITEILIAMGSVVTVVGAIAAILYRVTRGDGQRERLDKLKAELERERAGAPPT